MDRSISVGKGKMKDNEMSIFPVPFSLENTDQDFSINIDIKNSKEEIINQAFKFHSQGNISEASKYYQYFINKGFNDHIVFSNYAIILKNIGKIKDAEFLLRKAIKIKPDFAEAYYNLGTVLIGIGNLKEAELCSRKVIELKPDSSSSYLILGGILRELGNLKEAELSIRKAIELNPDVAESHDDLGSLLKYIGNPKEAELSIRKALEINPNYAKSYFNLGIILMDSRNLKEAELYTRKAIQLKSDFAEAYLNLGLILKDLGNLREAEINTRKAIELKPYSANAYSNLGGLLLQKGDYDLSLEYFSKSSQLLNRQKNKDSNRNKLISKAKIEHDIEQFEYLASQGYETQKFNDLAILYKKVSSEINWSSETQLIFLNKEYQSLLKDSYNCLINQINAPKLKQGVVTDSLNIEKISDNYFDHEFGLTYIDDFLNATALDLLRKFLLGSTIWFNIKKDGYIGAYLKEGLANPLIIQIADELRKKFPKIFKNYPINQIWAFKYDSRAKNQNSTLRGINVHADFAAINVNFWITPNEANLNPKSGGLIVYDVEAPKEWDFQTYNNDQKRIREQLKKSKGNTKVIPYKENRAVVFNSNLFHETDTYEFKEGYENRRINVTMLFGSRN